MTKQWLHRIATAFALVTLAACSAGGANLAGAPGESSRQAEMMRAVPINQQTAPSVGPQGVVTGAAGAVLNAAAGAIKHVCPPGAGKVSCNAIERTPQRRLGAGTDASLLEGYHPADLQSAYALPSAAAGFGQTIAIVVPFEDPSAEADLAVYRSTFGLPPCTTTNHCFRKVAAPGTAADVAWAKEMSIDLDMASAVCPNCNLLVVESGSADTTALAYAVSAAVRMGATVVSNSYASPEGPDAVAADALWNHPGVPIVAGAGDAGYGVMWPAASTYVTAVGGTTLARDSSSARGWREQAWSNSGSGCSKYIAKPAWQHDNGCAMRSVADVSAIADPNPGVAVYDSFGANGWSTFGGTSVAAPIVAGVYALAGNGNAINNASYVYAHAAALNDITSGSNASCGSYLCASGAGYDGPSGLGSPKGIGAF